MSLYGDAKTATITIATSATDSAEVDLGNNYEYLKIIIPALTAAQIYLKVSPTTGGTFAELGNGAARTASTSGSYNTTFRLGGHRFIKVCSSANQLADRVFTVQGYRM